MFQTALHTRGGGAVGVLPIKGGWFSGESVECGRGLGDARRQRCGVVLVKRMNHAARRVSNSLSLLGAVYQVVVVTVMVVCLCVWRCVCDCV